MELLIDNAVRSPRFKRLVGGALPLAETVLRGVVANEAEFGRTPAALPELRQIALRNVPWPYTPADLEDSMVVVAWPALQLVPEFQAAVSALGTALPAPMGRAFVLALEPGGKIELDGVSGAYATAMETALFALTPGLLCWAGEEIGGEVQQLQPGELWWIDRTGPHGMANLSESWAMMLALDMIGTDTARAWLRS